MLKNYFDVDENLKLSSFLKNVNEKKNSHYIILKGFPAYYVDIYDIALKSKNFEEKLKNFKKRLPYFLEDENVDILEFLIKSSNRVVEKRDGYFDFILALKMILEKNLDFLDLKISQIKKKEVYALNLHDKISSSKNLFLNKKINLLPVIDGLKVIGELRPIDFLISDLFSFSKNENNLFLNKKEKNSFNLNVENIFNNKPILINKDFKIRDFVQILVDKKLPSLIIVDNYDKLYSVLSYSDIFKLYENFVEIKKYNVEFSGTNILYEDDFNLIKDYADKSLNKISSFSQYDNLKINFKSIGNLDAGHKRRLNIKMLLSYGNKIIQVEDEISSGISDEIHNNKEKTRWNIPLLVQNLLRSLENKVKENKRKTKIFA